MAMDLSTLFLMNYGVYIVTTMDGKRPTGCVANSAMQVTNEPNALAVSMNRDNFTNSCMKECGRFVLNILSEQSEASIIGRFGFCSGKDTDKFDGVGYKLIDGLPVLDTAQGYVICEIDGQMELSTHTLFTAQIVDCQKQYEGKPMTYDYYHKVIKGKSPKNAPTYIPDEALPQEKPASGWVCTICGYVYDGDLNALPDDWKCPVCGVTKEQFIKQGGEENIIAADPHLGAYVCDICGYVLEGDINDLADDWKCPICGLGKEHLVLKKQ